MCLHRAPEGSEQHIALPSPEEIACHEAKSQTAKMGLPCLVWQDGDYDKTSNAPGP